ncbi:MAG: hypothetical protein Q9195_008417 [Heterodermia aff. obscurata]
MASPSNDAPAKKPRKKSMGNSSNLGSTWTEANIRELYDLRQAKKSWTEIGAAVNRTGGAAQQQWMRMQRENHPLMAEDHGTKTPIIEKGPKDESPPDVPDGKCQVCGKFGFVEDGELVRCFKCQEVYHKSCHQPPVPQKYLESTVTPWHCGRCVELEASIGSTLAENLHTALEGASTRKRRQRSRSNDNEISSDEELSTQLASQTDSPKPRRKRHRTKSSGVVSSEENMSETTAVPPQLDVLRNQVQNLEKNLAEVMAAQKSKDAEIDKLRDAVEGLKKATLTERRDSSPLNGWLSKTKKRITGFGGASAS